MLSLEPPFLHTLTVTESERRRLVFRSGRQPGVERIGGGEELVRVPLRPTAHRT